MTESAVDWKSGDQLLLTGPEWSEVYQEDSEGIWTIELVFGLEQEGTRVTFTDDPGTEWVLSDDDDAWAVQRVEGGQAFEHHVREVLHQVGDLLVQKNASYGNNALDPVRIFSKADPVEQLKVRIDDKLGRLMRGNNDFDEDTVLDLIGYLTLLRVAQQS